MGENKNWLEDDEPLRTNPSRSDWLSNVWSYIHAVEHRVLDLEERISKIEHELLRLNSRPIRFITRQKSSLDED